MRVFGSYFFFFFTLHFKFVSNVADPGCLSRIRIPDPDPGSNFFPSRIRIVSILDLGSASKNLSILTKKKVSKL
jgi:hypothetical protein